MMQNISAVTGHLRSLDASYPLTVVPTVGGHLFHKSRKSHWRCYSAVPNAHTVDECDTPALASKAAHAFAEFVAKLADFDAASLHVTIPDFHNTTARFAALASSRETASKDRLALAKDALDELLDLKNEATQLDRLDLPMRVVHNDTKINNVMFNDAHEPVCVIDLDTVMPGLVHHDFGDLVRTAACTEPEASGNFTNVQLDLERYAAIEAAFKSHLTDVLTATELDTLALGPACITLELSARFLTDYLSGDPYFGASYAAQNLDRARNQLALARSMRNHLGS